MDRSRVHILLCDHDRSSGSETLSLLRKCSYQVTAVKSARQALDVLNSSRCADVDLFLSEVELPHENGCGMLKDIMGQERLKRIPVVVMSERDEMTVVARCLRLGAVDYLVKPLRSNEVLNLWTHMWRRRRMLSLPDNYAIHGRCIPDFPVDSLASDTCESNDSNVTRLFSDVRRDKKRRPVSAINLQSEMTPHLELSLRLSSHFYAEPLTEQVGNSASKTSSDRVPHSESMVLSPKQGEMEEGHASAFASYAIANNASSEQSAITGSNSFPDGKVSEEAERENDLITARPHHLSVSLASDEAVASEERTDPLMRNSSITEKQSADVDVSRNSAGVSHGQPPLRCDSARESLSQGGQFHVMPPYHYPYQRFFLSCAAPATDLQHGGFVNQPLPSPPLQFYPHENLAGFPATHSAALPPSDAFSMTNSYSYYSVAPIPSPQFVPFSTWPVLAAATPAVDCKLRQAQRREAALNKFRLKRKDRCFEKKIRYASRKKLAEQRPRVKGQFVRRSTMAGNENRDGLYEEDEEEDADYEQCCSELETNSTLESIDLSSKIG